MLINLRANEDISSLKARNFDNRSLKN